MNKIGLTVPVYSNFLGLTVALNSIVTDLNVKTEIVPTGPKDLSVAAGWNIGCRKLFADEEINFVVVSNDDVIYPKYMFDVLLDLFVDYAPSNTAILTPSNCREDLVKSNNILNIDCRDLDKDELEKSFVAHPDFSCFMLSREAWDTCGEFDENFERAYFEDSDYHARIALSGMSAYSCGMSYVHVGSVTQNADARNPRVPGTMFDRNAQYFKAKWGCNSVNEEEAMRRFYYKTPFNDPDKTIKDWEKAQ
jgi:hypothetical protein